MKLKHEPSVILEQYNDFEDAEKDRATLEDSGFHPTVREEPCEFEAGVSLFVLEAPESEYESAYDTLVEVWETEQDLTLEEYEK